MSPSPSKTPTVAVNDIGSAEDFLAAVDATIKNFDDGDLVTGVIVAVTVSSTQDAVKKHVNPAALQEELQHLE